LLALFLVAERGIEKKGVERKERSQPDEKKKGWGLKTSRMGRTKGQGGGGGKKSVPGAIKIKGGAETVTWESRAPLNQQK